MYYHKEVGILIKKSVRAAISNQNKQQNSEVIKIMKYLCNSNHSKNSNDRKTDIMEKKKIVFIVNPISGTQNKKTILELIEQHIDREKYDYVIEPTQFAGHAIELASIAASENAFMVVAIGGDGTINEIGRALVHTNTALGIIPCGSGNGLARHLQIPMDAQKAIEIINEGVVACVDYGKINEIPFFCTCGVGFDALVSMKFANSGKRGMLTYLENMLQESLTYKPETYDIEWSNGLEKQTCKAYLIACANASQYGNNAYIAPQASLSDGLMDVTILEPFTVLDVPALSFQLFNRTIDKNSRIKTFRCGDLRIHRAKEGLMHFDGDPIMAGTDLDVKIIPQGLHIVTNSKQKKRKKAGTEPFLLQVLSDYFYAVDSLKGNLVQKNKKLQELNRSMFRKIHNK